MGVGPRDGRQTECVFDRVGVRRSAASDFGSFAPISRLLILLGNALTPGRGFRNGPFGFGNPELREVVVDWRSKVWWPTRNAG